MREIPLTRGYVALVDDADFEELAKYKWHVQLRHGMTYARRARLALDGGNRRTGIFMHRQILKAPDGVDVDHANHCGVDNQRHNIRLATKSQNRVNSTRVTYSASGYRGVYWSNERRRWEVYLFKDGKRVHAGRFKNLDVAARASDALAIRLHGEFARLNFPDTSAEALCG